MGDTAPVVEAIPWSSDESYEYNLEIEGVDETGTCTLKTEPEFEPGLTRLSRLCGSEKGNRDDGMATVDSETLRPHSSERTRLEAESGDMVTWRSTYRAGEVYFEADDDGDTNETTRDLPQPTEDAPNPAWYDDESLFWVARTVPLREGFEGRYAHVINAGLPRVLGADIEVEGIEEAEFEGGKAEAWKVEFGRDNTRYTVWVELEAPHRVLRAQVEGATYKLIPQE